MIPIEAEWHYNEQVEEDPENPNHAEWRGLGFAFEPRVAHGYVDDVVTTMFFDESRGKIYDKTLVRFMVDKGEYYTPTMVEPQEIRIPKKTYNEYVKRAIQIGRV